MRQAGLEAVYSPDRLITAQVQPELLRQERDVVRLRLLRARRVMQHLPALQPAGRAGVADGLRGAVRRRRVVPGRARRPDARRPRRPHEPAVRHDGRRHEEAEHLRDVPRHRLPSTHRFNQANPARSHPKARQPEPGGYKRNWLEGVDGEEEVQAAPENRMDRSQSHAGPDNSLQGRAGRRSAQNAGGGAPTFDVRLPPNARPGVTIMARAPNGRNVRLTVPHERPPGGTITMRY